MDSFPYNYKTEEGAILATLLTVRVHFELKVHKHKYCGTYQSDTNQ